MKNDFSKFVVFVKGLIETGMVIRYSGKELRREMKLHFNRCLNSATEFEKVLHQHLGPEMSKFEDDINSEVIRLVWLIFEMEGHEREQFLNYINEFEASPESGDS